ncbi:MAG: hypothetical protein JOZ16_14575, partial [Methylobacteriaceae bacterium]|nr:hypothetical protein [Methylobacteriaceae bacterium]
MIDLRKLALIFRNDVRDYKARRDANKAEKARIRSPGFRDVHRESLRRLNSALRENAVAIVGVAPPTRSGIATYNQAILTGLATAVDFFGDFAAVDEVARMVDAVAVPPSRVRVFSDSVFFDAIQLNHYRTAIFVLGNSDQNVFALRASHLAEGAGVKSIFWYVHDPFLFNLYLKSLGANHRRFRQEMLDAYGNHSAAAIDALGWRPNLRGFLENKWLTLRPLLNGHKITGILVNSTAARDLVEAEAHDMLAPGTVHVLFLPSLPPPPPIAVDDKERRPLRIGTFGIPDPVKRTERILAAWRRIKAAKPDAELILAGYL